MKVYKNVFLELKFDVRKKNVCKTTVVRKVKKRKECFIGEIFMSLQYRVAVPENTNSRQKCGETE